MGDVTNASSIHDANSVNAPIGLSDGSAEAVAARAGRGTRRRAGSKPARRRVAPIDARERDGLIPPEPETYEGMPLPEGGTGMGPGPSHAEFSAAAPVPDPFVPLTAEEVEHKLSSAARVALYGVGFVRVRQGDRIDMDALDGDAEDFAHDIAPEVAKLRWRWLHGTVSALGAVGAIAAPVLGAVLRGFSRKAKERTVPGVIVRQNASGAGE